MVHIVRFMLRLVWRQEKILRPVLYPRQIFLLKIEPPPGILLVEETEASRFVEFMKDFFLPDCVEAPKFFLQGGEFDHMLATAHALRTR